MGTRVTCGGTTSIATSTSDKVVRPRNDMRVRAYAPRAEMAVVSTVTGMAIASDVPKLPPTPTTLIACW